VLVIAGLHVGALAFALYWICRKLRFTPLWRALFTLTLLFSYVAVVEQRAPVLRATLMAATVVLGGFFFRRLDLLNSADWRLWCCLWQSRWHCATRAFN